MKDLIRPIPVHSVGRQLPPTIFRDGYIANLAPIQCFESAGPRWLNWLLGKFGLRLVKI